MHRFNAEGIEGLKSRKSPGREPFLTAAQKAELRALVIQGPDPTIHNVVRWRCADLRAEVARRWSVEVHESTIGAWLGELGLTRLQPRPVHPRRILRPRWLLKKLRKPGARGAQRHNPRHTDRNLVPGRGKGRPAGNARLYLGTGRFATADGAR